MGWVLQEPAFLWSTRHQWKNRPLERRTELGLTIWNQHPRLLGPTMRRASSEEKTSFLATLSRWDTEYCILVHPCEMTFICLNKLITAASLKLQIYQQILHERMNEWKLEHRHCTENLCLKKNSTSLASKSSQSNVSENFLWPDFQFMPCMILCTVTWNTWQSGYTKIDTR